MKAPAVKRVVETFGPDSNITRRWRAASCEGKQAFESPSLARKVAAKSPEPLHHYRCRICGKFHVGKIAKRISN